MLIDQWSSGAKGQILTQGENSQKIHSHCYNFYIPHDHAVFIPHYTDYECIPHIWLYTVGHSDGDSLFGSYRYFSHLLHDNRWGIIE